MTLHEKRVALAAIVRTTDGRVSTVDRIEAIRQDNRLAGTDPRRGSVRQSLNSWANLPNDRTTTEVL